MPQRIVILADVHLGTTQTQLSGQNYTYAPDLLRMAVGRIEKLNPDRVISLGDLVNMGAATDYQLAGEILSPLRGKLLPLVGNHELLSGSLADFKREMASPASYTSTLGTLPATFLNSGIEGLPPSQWHGRLGPDQLDLLDRRLSAHPSSPHLVFVHHPLANSVRRSEQVMMALDNSPLLQWRLLRHGKPIVLFTGHCHYQSRARIGNIHCVGCPATCFWPHAFLVVDIDPTGIRFHSERLFDRPEDSPDRSAIDSAYRARAEGTADDQSGTISFAE